MKLAFWRSFVSPKVFEALLTQDLFLFVLFGEFGVKIVAPGSLTAFDLVLDGSSCPGVEIGGDSETGRLAGDKISRVRRPVGLEESLLLSLTE